MFSKKKLYHTFFYLLDALGLLFGIFYLVRMVQEKSYTWIYGIIAVSLYALSCYHNRIYGEMILQGFYVILGIYGWYTWTNKKNKEIQISRLEFKYYVPVLTAALLLSLLFYFPLKALNSSLPLLDSLSNGFAIIATFLASRKKIENWILWIPIDILISYMMFLKGMPFYLVLYIFYTLFAIYGYYKWKQEISE